MQHFGAWCFLFYHNVTITLLEFSSSKKGWLECICNFHVIISLCHNLTIPSLRSAMAPSCFNRSPVCRSRASSLWAILWSSWKCPLSICITQTTNHHWKGVKWVHIFSWESPQWWCPWPTQTHAYTHTHAHKSQHVYHILIWGTATIPLS